MVAKIWHSLRALVWMNEPPSLDLRAVLVAAGVLLSIGALLHVPKMHRLPLSVACGHAGRLRQRAFSRIRITIPAACRFISCRLPSR